MNEIKALRNKQINDFMATFDNLKNVDTDEIIEGLRQILVETPAVDFEYGVDYQPILSFYYGLFELFEIDEKIYIDISLI